MRRLSSLLATPAILFLALTGPGTSSVLAATHAEGVSPAEAQTYSLLRTLRDPQAPGPLVVGEQILSKGVLVLPGLFKVLDKHRIPDPLDPDGPAQALSEPQVEAIMVALDFFGRSAAYPAWEQYFELGGEAELEPDSVAVSAAVTALGGFGMSQDLDQLWALIHLKLGPDPTLSRPLRMTLETAITSILKRDSRALRQIRSVWTSLPDEWVDSLARAVGKTGDPQGLVLILEMLNLATGHERVVASQVCMLGPSNNRGLNSEVVARLVNLVDLASSMDAQTAILALGALENLTVIPLLIEFLDDERGGMNSSALHSLKELTGASFHGSSAVWNLWYEGELKWAREEQDLALVKLRSPDPNVVKSSLKVIARHRLNRHELASAVLDTLSSRNVSVRLAAVQVLGEFDSRWTYSGLVECLNDSAEIVRQASHSTLTRLSGLNHGLAPADWEQAQFP
jgi:HEAT repeat protein